MKRSRRVVEADIKTLCNLLGERSSLLRGYQTDREELYRSQARISFFHSMMK